jgi:3-oxoacyl-[acyl-carrier protein] reductase
VDSKKQAGDVSAPLLQGRVILVTGASRGIGAASARLLARHGGAIGVNYRSSRESADQVVQEITASGGRAVSIQGDVGDASQVEKMLEQLTEAFGPVDTLVLNADAVHQFTIAPFTDLTWEQYEDILLGETKAIFLPTKAALPSMIEHKRGCIVAIGSTLSRATRMGMAGHSSGKAAVDALVRSLASELGQHGIRVNVVSPGLVITEGSSPFWGGPPQPGQPNPVEMIQRITPLGRVAEADDIAGAVLMMVSDAARFVTGTFLPVNGGSQMW